MVGPLLAPHTTQGPPKTHAGHLKLVSPPGVGQLLYRGLKQFRSGKSAGYLVSSAFLLILLLVVRQIS